MNNKYNNWIKRAIMEIKTVEMCAVVATDINGINNKEMRQMYELKNRIDDVLISHKPNSKKKKYISDDDLKLMHAILHVFTKHLPSNYSSQISAFDDTLNEFSKIAKLEED